MAKISQKSFDMTVAEEVSSKAYYLKHYTHPEWPGLSSGPTVGIGYDLGQATRQKISDDWKDLVPPDMLMTMMGCAGFVGANGKTKTAAVKNLITISWDAGIKVFGDRDIPQWTAAVIKAVPGADKLTPSCLGVLVDIAYNRGNGGWTSTTDRFREMNHIRYAVANNKLYQVPDEIENMKRLWPNTIGLQHRCDHRIAMWKIGMQEVGQTNVPVADVPPAPAQLDPAVPLAEGAARTKPPATTTAQNGTTAAVALTSSLAIQQAHSHGFIGTEGLLFCGFLGVMVVATLWITWYRRRNPT